MSFMAFQEIARWSGDYQIPNLRVTGSNPVGVTNKINELARRLHELHAFRYSIGSVIHFHSNR